jgi:hypothetical protein
MKGPVYRIHISQHDPENKGEERRGERGGEPCWIFGKERKWNTSNATLPLKPLVEWGSSGDVQSKVQGERALAEGRENKKGMTRRYWSNCHEAVEIKVRDKYAAGTQAQSSQDIQLSFFHN